MGLEHKQSRWKRAAPTNGSSATENSADAHEAAIESDDEEDDDEMNRLDSWICYS